jgi:hypothetical protein
VSISEIIRAEPLSRTTIGRARPAPPTPGPRALVAPPAFPDIEPGQLWLIELPAAKALPSETLRRTLARANVVIYDCSLAAATAALLPIGGYAEPAAAVEGGVDPAAERCVRFARDGWSVARLLSPRPPRRQRGEQVRRLAAALDTAKIPAALRVTLWAETPEGAAEPVETRLGDLPEAVLAQPRDARLTIDIAALDSGAAMRLNAVAANGLAG